MLPAFNDGRRHRATTAATRAAATPPARAPPPLGIDARPRRAHVALDPDIELRLEAPRELSIWVCRPDPEP